jgi:hypothetical protein
MEWLDSTKDSYFFDGHAEEPSGFYETNGMANHYYYTHLFTENFKFRLGWRQQFYQRTPMGIGPMADNKTMIETYYANVRVDF